MLALQFLQLLSILAMQLLKLLLMLARGLLLALGVDALEFIDPLRMLLLEFVLLMNVSAIGRLKQRRIPVRMMFPRPGRILVRPPVHVMPLVMLIVVADPRIPHVRASRLINTVNSKSVRQRAAHWTRLRGRSFTLHAYRNFPVAVYLSRLARPGALSSIPQNVDGRLEPKLRCRTRLDKSPNQPLYYTP